MDVEFSGEIWFWRGPSPYHFVTVPEAQSEQLRTVAGAVTYGWGMVPVHARVGETRWDTSLYPKDGGYVVPLKDAVRHAEGLEAGHVIAVRLTVRHG
ncbi:MAG: DUF1905 domain-containing protein [Micromonosporaceae bacterium]